MYRYRVQVLAKFIFYGPRSCNHKRQKCTNTIKPAWQTRCMHPAHTHIHTKKKKRKKLTTLPQTKFNQYQVPKELLPLAISCDPFNVSFSCWTWLNHNHGNIGLLYSAKLKWQWKNTENLNKKYISLKYNETYYFRAVEASSTS